MARRPRVEFSGAVYHVTGRGNQRADIFLSDDNRLYFLNLLGKIALRLDWKVHAYCLMSNHYHLLIETSKPNLGKGMQVLGTSYTQAFNRQNGKVGHVFQGRYKAVLVEKESHLLEAIRYIVNNPVAAFMVSATSEWAWSSYRATAGLAATPEWLETEWTLGQFHHADRKKAIAGYRLFVSEAEKGNPFEDLKLGLIAGSEAFAERMKPLVEDSLSSDKSSRVRAQRRPLKELFGDVKDRAERNERMLEAYDRHGYSLLEIAKFFEMHESGISRIVATERKKMLGFKA